MLYSNACVLKTLFSYNRISRRMTLSRVVVLPVKMIRLMKYCLPSSIRSVTSTVGGAALVTGATAASEAGVVGCDGSGSSLNL